MWREGHLHPPGPWLCLLAAYFQDPGDLLLPLGLRTKVRDRCPWRLGYSFSCYPEKGICKNLFEAPISLTTLDSPSSSPTSPSSGGQQPSLGKQPSGPSLLHPLPSSPVHRWAFLFHFPQNTAKLDGGR